MYNEKLFSYPNELPRSDELIDEAIYVLGGGDAPLSIEDLTKNGYQTSRVLEMQLEEILGDNLPIPFYFENMEWNGLLKSDWFPEHGNVSYPLEHAYKLSEKGIERLKEIQKTKEENVNWQMRF